MRLPNTARIFRALKLIDLTNDDVFVDMGSGMGRTTFAASFIGAKRAIGVEIVEDLQFSRCEFQAKSAKTA